LRNERYGDPAAGQRPVCDREANSYAERRSGSKAARIARPRNAEQGLSVFCCFRRRFAADVFEGHDAVALVGSTRHAIAECGIELRNGIRWRFLPARMRQAVRSQTANPSKYGQEAGWSACTSCARRHRASSWRRQVLARLDCPSAPCSHRSMSRDCSRYPSSR